MCETHLCVCVCVCVCVHACLQVCVGILIYSTNQSMHTAS